MKKELAANNSIRNHRQLTDRELMEQIYELLAGVNAKLDKLGLLKISLDLLFLLVMILLIIGKVKLTA